jgi:predicted chitinase
VSQQPEQPSKVESWTYPFPLTHTNGPSTPEAYLAALAAAQDGFYPIGTNGLWHGGIHFGAETADRFNQDGGVKCIADGEVVVFRLDSELQRLNYPGGIQAGYSKGFTLVRHRLVLPPVPTSPGGPNSPTPAAPTTAPQNATPPEQDVLTFFSLYMHTLPQKGYDVDPAHQSGRGKTLPTYYGTDDVYSIETRASDPRLTTEGHPDHSTLGLRVRSSPSAHGNPVGWLARGTKVRIGQRHGAWGQIAGVVAGNISSYKEGDTLSANASSGWIFLAQAHHESQPLAVDKVYVLPKARRIRAGETVAYLGEYQRFAEARAHHTLPPQLGERPLLHVEVFTGDDLAQYISRSRARAQQLDPKSRTLLLISAGAKLVQPALQDTSVSGSVKAASDSPSSGPWCKVNAVDAAGHTLTGQACWISRADLHGNGVRQAWRNFPLNVSAAGGEAAAWARVIHTDATEKCAESGNKTWYRVSVADANDTQVDGWVCDHGHPLVELKSPWDWPGFDLATLSAPVSDMFQRALFIAQDGTPDEITSFEEAFNSVQSDATVKKLEDAIDKAGQHDGKITAQELKTALGKPWLADRIDHLIVKYESEWGGDMSKWDALDSHMQAGLPVWQAEKTRIEALRFWHEVATIDGFPSSATVFHIHPLGLVGNFMVPADLITLEMLNAVDPGGSVDYHRQILPYLNKYAKGYGVATPRRIAHFLSQVAVESEFKNVEERLDYSERRMKEVYGCKLPPHGNHTAKFNIVNGDIACNFGQLRPALWASPDRYAHNPENLANLVYADRYHNGPEASGDGYKYRGRGLIQTTFKANYEVFNREHNHRFPDDPKDFVSNPDLLLSDLEYGVESAFVYWAVNRGVNSVADAGDVAAVTQQINGGQNGHAERLSAYNKVAPLLGLPQESN